MAKQPSAFAPARMGLLFGLLAGLWTAVLALASIFGDRSLGEMAIRQWMVMPQQRDIDAFLIVVPVLVPCLGAGFAATLRVRSLGATFWWGALAGLYAGFIGAVLNVIVRSASFSLAYDAMDAHFTTIMGSGLYIFTSNVFVLVGGIVLGPVCGAIGAGIGRLLRRGALQRSQGG